MKTPGSNLLKKAFRKIARDSFTLYRYTGTTNNAIGFDVHTYASPEPVTGSIQAVDRSLYADMGLDFTRRYIQIWIDQDIEDLYRGRSGDQLEWLGDRYEILSETDWFPVDGWNSFIAVQVPAP